MSFILPTDLPEKLALALGSSLVCSIWSWFAVQTNQFLRFVTIGSIPFKKRTVWLLKVLAVIVGAGGVCGVLVQIGCPYYLAAIPAGVVVFLSLREKVEDFVPAKPPQDPGSYESAWREHRRICRVNNWSGLISLAAFFLLGAAMTMAESLPRLILLPLAVMLGALFLASAAAAAVNKIKWAYWPCPRCGRAFRGLWRIGIPQRCAYCGLHRPQKDQNQGALSQGV